MRLYANKATTGAEDGLGVKPKIWYIDDIFYNEEDNIIGIPMVLNSNTLGIKFIYF